MIYRKIWHEQCSHFEKPGLYISSMHGFPSIDPLEENDTRRIPIEFISCENEPKIIKRTIEKAIREKEKRWQEILKEVSQAKSERPVPDREAQTIICPLYSGDNPPVWKSYNELGVLIFHCVANGRKYLFVMLTHFDHPSDCRTDLTDFSSSLYVEEDHYE